MRIAHFSDLHLGYSHLNKKADDGRNQRLVDFERSSIAFAEAAVEAHIDIAVVAGDLFHKINMFPAALSGAVSFVNILESAGIPLLVIGGNHDEGEAIGTYNGLKFLDEHTSVNLFLDQGYYDTEEARFHLVSYRLISRSAAERGELVPFEFVENKANILVTHGYVVDRSVEYDIMSEAETIIPDAWLDDPRFDLFLLGHIHKHYSPREKAFYAGSAERRNFGEASTEPAFYIHELTGTDVSTASVFLKDLRDDLPRPMINLAYDLENMSVKELNKEILAQVENADTGAMIKVTLDNAPVSLDRNQYRVNWEAKARQSDSISFEVNVRSHTMSKLMDIDFSAPPTDIGQGLIDYISKQNLTEENNHRTEVLKLSKEIITEATEKILSSKEE